jgi:Zn-dependent protease with chaperone function/Tfp pilus assembly protein PilE
MELVHRHEPPLYAASMAIGAIVWLALVAATFGAALIWALFFLLIYLFAQSGFISHLRGNAVELGERQFPELYAQYREACRILEMEEPPTAYLMMSDGVLNALATRFLRRHYVVVYSSIVEALRSRPEALRFYFGHELAHIKRRHLSLAWLRWPASILPLLGAGYRRAQEYTCDLHGLAASASGEDAMAALGVLASGGEKLPQLNTEAFIDQQARAGGFWMSYHELTGDYPWLCKRVAHVASVHAGKSDRSGGPARHPAAWILAAFTPRLGIAGGGMSMLILIAVIGVLAAIAIPAYQDYTLRAESSGAFALAETVKAAAQDYVVEHGAYPESLEEIGIAETYDTGPVAAIQVTDEGFELYLTSSSPRLDGATVVLSALAYPDGSISWDCTGGTLAAKYRPAHCRQTP